MAKATGKKVASSSGDSGKAKRKKPTVTRARKAAPIATTTKAKAKAPAKRVVARKVVARKTTAKKVVAKKVLAKKVVAPKVLAKKVVATKVLAEKSPAAKRTKAPADATKRLMKTARKPQPTRSRRSGSMVVEVSPSMIDTSSAAEVAARLVVDHMGPALPSPLGNIFTPPPAVAVKRGSSALRHVKEMLNKPVARQLDGVFGPAPVPPETLRRFLRGEKVARTQRVRGSTNFHGGQSTVPHRSVG